MVRGKDTEKRRGRTRDVKAIVEKLNGGAHVNTESRTGAQYTTVSGLSAEHAVIAAETLRAQLPVEIEFRTLLVVIWP